MTLPEMVPVPAQGRRFATSRRVRWGDADDGARLRLDSIARYAQDISNDDTRDVGHDPMAAWIVRRTSIVVEQVPRTGEVLDLVTFCGGLGSRWAERRTAISGEHGGRVDVASVWVAVDAVSGRPARLPADFVEVYGEAAGGREISARRTHPGPPSDGVTRRPWPLRSTDLDGLHHVNNAATWEPVEDELARRGLRATSATIEYGDAIELADPVELLAARVDDGLHLWLTVGADVRASVAVQARPI